MITGVHFVEAYGLNPAIYSAHLKLHPLLVLTVLVVAEHSLGVWGLLLAVPLTVFALDYVLRYPVSGSGGWVGGCAWACGACCWLVSAPHRLRPGLRPALPGEWSG